ncbi:hypothetical protein KBC59_02930 [Patescibacteria group bacterium]|nr:hypothetical protein [Patescibacteria group bacterium]
MNPVTQVYYFPVDHEGNEVGEPLAIGLNTDGTADLTKLPEAVIRDLTTSGVSDELKMGRVFPKDGARFLKALLHTSNGYRRFRSTIKNV